MRGDSRYPQRSAVQGRPESEPAWGGAAGLEEVVAELTMLEVVPEDKKEPGRVIPAEKELGEFRGTKQHPWRWELQADA